MDVLTITLTLGLIVVVLTHEYHPLLDIIRNTLN